MRKTNLRQSVDTVLELSFSDTAIWNKVAAEIAHEFTCIRLSSDM